MSIITKFENAQILINEYDVNIQEQESSKIQLCGIPIYTEYKNVDLKEDNGKYVLSYSKIHINHSNYFMQYFLRRSSFKIYNHSVVGSDSELDSFIFTSENTTNFDLFKSSLKKSLIGHLGFNSYTLGYINPYYNEKCIKYRYELRAFPVSKTRLSIYPLDNNCKDI